jgi:hypothetical protein
MQLGSIHPDEQSARQALATLIAAGIEPERVKLMGPRPTRAPEASATDVRRLWMTRLVNLTSGLGIGAALGVLACVVLVLTRADLFASDPVDAMIGVVATAAVVGAAVSTLVHRRYVEMLPFFSKRTRRSARGWAVVVHARDVEQRALAAEALARVARRGTVAA